MFGSICSRQATRSGCRPTWLTVADTVQLCPTVVWWGRFVHGHREEGRRALALERGSAYSGDGDRGDVRERSVLVREAMVHPYYSPVGASARAGVVSMAAYLVFWAVVVTVAGRRCCSDGSREVPRWVHPPGTLP